jgi:bifunctional non-homologous end joining protein LigD
VREAPRGPNWLHEIKHDEYRTICVIDQGKVSIYTRRRHNWADRMPSIERALEGLKVRSAVIDGEAIVIGKDGVSHFFSLDAALARRNAPRAVLVAFDLVYLDGEDMRECELEDRRAVLADRVSKAAVLREHRGWWAAGLASRLQHGPESIILKRRGF